MMHPRHITLALLLVLPGVSLAKCDDLGSRLVELEVTSCSWTARDANGLPLLSALQGAIIVARVTSQIPIPPATSVEGQSFTIEPVSPPEEREYFYVSSGASTCDEFAPGKHLALHEFPACCDVSYAPLVDPKCSRLGINHVPGWLLEYMAARSAGEGTEQ
ncbi:MAG: hypothetical protein KDI19_15490 [Pseudomonadales bacterium]|nr:hypothetical protein [Pseudomonadales bacterium]